MLGLGSPVSPLFSLLSYVFRLFMYVVSLFVGGLLEKRLFVEHFGYSPIEIQFVDKVLYRVGDVFT